ncbi:MAG TPA: ABC transporter permease [Candidatus Paceibacterota bacterium]|nr:ABC transporter permease [Candidatus Paceibacterota bacterium]
MSGIHWIGIYTMIRREVARTMRVVVQTLVSPVMSAALYIFIFGKVIGTKIDTIAGVPYITFVFPGILTLSVINAAFASSSSALYMARFSRAIDELLVSPFSYIEMIFGYMLGSMMRSLMVSVLILIVGMFFGAVTLTHPLMFFVYVVAVASIFSLLGILVALWANNFEQLSALNTFIITPFTYLGGIFYSITMLPSLATHITLANPFFYFVDGIRSSMIGITEARADVGAFIIAGLLLVLGGTVYTLFKRGWGIRV